MQKQDNTPTKTRLRKNLNADALNAALRSAFGQVSDPRCQKDIKISLTDALVSGFAMFQFKDPSLLAFNERCKDEYELDNLKHLYGIERVPAYSSMSDILDIVSPNDLRKAFLVPFREERLWSNFKF
jgi:hypothetical protein